MDYVAAWVDIFRPLLTAIIGNEDSAPHREIGDYVLHRLWNLDPGTDASGVPTTLLEAARRRIPVGRDLERHNDVRGFLVPKVAVS